MRKKIYAFVFGLMIIAGFVGNQDSYVRAAEMEVAMPQDGRAEEMELQMEQAEVSLIQDGYYHSAYMTAMDEIAVLAGEEAWKTTFKQRITDAMKNFQTEVYLADLAIYKSDANHQLMTELYQEVIDGNPSLFYAYGGFGYTYVPGGNVYEMILYYDEGYLDVNGNVDMTKVAAYQTALNRAVTVAKAEMSDVEKVLAVHDYLVLNCTYDYQNYLQDTLPDASYSSYGALVNKTAVCSGYSMAMAEILRTLGFPCYVVASDDMNHAWNLVYLDGAWHHLDATWNDPVDNTGADYNGEGMVSHKYFLKSDTEMKAAGYHNWFQEFTKKEIPVANQDNSYAGTVFRKQDIYAGSSFTYYFGYWYYLTAANEQNASDNFYIMRSKLDGSDSLLFQQLGTVNYVQMQDGVLFLADAEGVYLSPLSGNMQRERIITALGSKIYANYNVTEFALYGDYIIGVEWKDRTSGTFLRAIYSMATRETVPMPNLKLTSLGTYNYTSNPGAAYKDGVFQLRYWDGTSIAVNSAEVNLIHDAMETEGVYDVTAEWRGLNTSYQVSRKDDFAVSDVLVSDTNWQYPGIRYVFDNGYMGYISPNSTRFSPDVTLSRSMLVQILYAMEGKPDVEYEQVFSDVEEGKWYADAVMWAYENGITSGYENGKFGVDDPIRREQAAVMLRQYAKNKDVDVTDGADLSGYTDYKKVSNWAVEAMSWANFHGVISGKGQTLDPGGNATRAEMAAMINKFCNNVIVME